MTNSLSLDAIALPDTSHAVLRTETQPARGPGAGAEVNAGALLVFGPGLPATSKSDVSESLLLAQLAANTALDRYASTTEWFAKVTSTLGKIGWVSSMSATSGSTTEEPPLDWRAIAGKSFGAMFGSAAAPMEAAIAAAGRVPAGSDAARLWASQTFAADQGRGLFLLAYADADRSGSVTLALMATGFTLTSADAPILTWASAASISQAALTLTLDTDVYDRVRAQITTKLGSRAATEIRAVPL